jgi:hypothetical protein
MQAAGGARVDRYSTVVVPHLLQTPRGEEATQVSKHGIASAEAESSFRKWWAKDNEPALYRSTTSETASC